MFGYVSSVTEITGSAVHWLEFAWYYANYDAAQIAAKRLSNQNDDARPRDPYIPISKTFQPVPFSCVHWVFHTHTNTHVSGLLYIQVNILDTGRDAHTSQCLTSRSLQQVTRHPLPEDNTAVSAISIPMIARRQSTATVPRWTYWNITKHKGLDRKWRAQYYYYYKFALK